MISTFVLLAALSNGYEPVPELHKVPGPAFLIPCKVQAAEQVAEIHLYVSADRGKTWQLYEAITPSKDSFTFVAKKSGEYWFAPRVKKKDGTLLPGDLTELAATQRVAVGTGSADADGPPPPTPPRRSPTVAVDELDEELNRAELELIRKEIKRLADVNSFTPEVEEKIDRLRSRLLTVRGRMSPPRDPFVSDPGRPAPAWGPTPPPTITPSAPSGAYPSDDSASRLIPVPNVPPALTPGEGRPVAPPPRSPAPRS